MLAVQVLGAVMAMVVMVLSTDGGVDGHHRRDGCSGGCSRAAGCVCNLLLPLLLQGFSLTILCKIPKPHL